MKKVLVAGEINADFILQGYRDFPVPGKEVLVDDFRMVLGSASAICAMGMARLGTPVAFLGKAGDDILGRFCLDAMRGRGIDVSRVSVDPDLKTGVTVAITSPKDRALVSFLGSIAALTAADVPPEAFAGFDHLHVSSYFLQDGLRPGVLTLFRAARSHGLTTSLDPGFDPSETWGGGLDDTLDETDLFFPNEVELRGLCGTADIEAGLRQLRRDRLRVVVKLGGDGAMTLEGDEIIHAPAHRVQPVDTTGAGDSFDAGFLHAWLRGQPVAACLRLAGACGALSTLDLGGTASQPTLAEAEAFLRNPSWA